MHENCVHYQYHGSQVIQVEKDDWFDYCTNDWDEAELDDWYETPERDDY